MRRQQGRRRDLGRLEVVLHHEIVEIGVRSRKVGPHILGHDDARIVVILVIGHLFITAFHGVDREFVIDGIRSVRRIHGQRHDALAARCRGIFHIEFFGSRRNRQVEGAGRARFEQRVFDEQRTALAVLFRIDRHIGLHVRFERQRHGGLGEPSEIRRHDRRLGGYCGLFRRSGARGVVSSGIDVGAGTEQHHGTQSKNREDFFHNAYYWQ